MNKDTIVQAGSYIALCTVIVGIDQWTKQFVEFIAPYDLFSWCTFQVHINRGVALGMLHTADPSRNWYILYCIMAIVSCMIVKMVVGRQERQALIAQVLIVSGAVSNMIDRVLHDGVIDFILLHWHNWSFPVFNIADVAIVMGIGMMLYYQPQTAAA